jgi:hypothetical protein
MSGEHEIDAGNRLNTTASKGLTAISGYIAEYKARQALGYGPAKRRGHCQEFATHPFGGDAR